MSRTYKKVAIVPTQTGSFSVRHDDNLPYFILLESKLYRKRKLYVDRFSSLLARFPFRHHLNKTQSFSIQKRIYSSYYNRIFNITFILYNETYNDSTLYPILLSFNRIFYIFSYKTHTFCHTTRKLRHFFHY